MQKIVEFREVASAGHRAGPCGQPAANGLASPTAVPSIEPIYAVVDSLARTLECIKSLSGALPSGPMRDKLEIERTNLVIGLFVARITAMRVNSTTEPATEALAEPDFSMAQRG